MRTALRTMGAAGAALLASAVLAGAAPLPVDGAPDTLYTPQARSASGLWAQVGGAVFPGAQAGDYDPKASPTPATVDFFAVRFFGEARGFAGGAACRDASTPAEGLSTCERVPAMYRYVRPTGRAGQWEKVALPGDDRPGYVAAIAWIGRDRALAVGGDTSPSAACPACGYPRREPARASPLETDDEYAARDPAGKARVWVYDHGSWCELGPDASCGAIPPLDGGPARALTALDCSPRPSDGEFCLAGGLQQLWTWKAGAFLKGYSNKSADYPSTDPLHPGFEDPRTEVDHAANFHYRVRSLRFIPGDVPQPLRAVGVTSGCCMAPPQDAPGTVLWSLGTDGTERWYIRPFTVDDSDTGKVPQGLRDSLYAVVPGGQSGTMLSAVAAPGGPADPNEPDARIVGPQSMMSNGPSVTTPVLAPLLNATGGGSTGRDTNLVDEATAPTFGGIRLVAGDGDVGGPIEPNAAGQNNTLQGTPPGSADNIVDWAVGSFAGGPSSGRALASTTTSRPRGSVPYSPLSCPPADEGTTAKTKCQASQDTLGHATESTGLYALSSYALNAYTAIDATGSGWAVGDRGAIECLGCNGTSSAGAATADPAPPLLGEPQDQALPDRGAYAAFQPLGHPEPGTVPALATQPVDKLRAPELLQTGSPQTATPQEEPVNSVSRIAMSRDGSEGWAVGAPLPGQGGTYATTLYHYRGGSWTPCAGEEIPGVAPADPACAQLAPLMRYVNTLHQYEPVTFSALARVPLERDDDPSNDDDFEVVAVGGGYQPPGESTEMSSVLRYREGRWSVDVDAMRKMPVNALTDVAFTAPDDGWIVTVGGFTGSRVLHYDGHGWTDCAAGALACDDGNGLLPIADGQKLQLAVAGSRVYLYGARITGGSSATATAASSGALILYRDPAMCEGAGGAGCWRSDDGGLDPKVQTSGTVGPPSDGSQIDALSVARNADGSYVGWALKRTSSGLASSEPTTPVFVSGSLLHLAPGGSAWSPWTVADASADYPLPTMAPRMLTFPGAGGEARALFAAASPLGSFSRGRAPLLEFDPARGRWSVVPTPFVPSYRGVQQAVGPHAVLQTIAPDEQGGAWVAARRIDIPGAGTGARRGSTWFYRYSDRRPRPVFTDAPHPIREKVTGAAGGGDGSFWVTTDSSTVYRYDRLTGWDRMRVPGWDAGRLVTNPAPATAVAIGPDGRGVVVGQNGRIADVTPASVALDPASGIVCKVVGGRAPCGTSRTLRAAAVAPDGSALVGGDARTVLWRPAGEHFRAAAPPPDSPTTQITGIAMPAPDRAWLVTTSGQVFVGTLSGGEWSWRPEAVTADGDPLTLRPNTRGLTYRLNAIAVDASGRGYAVGARGVVLQRTGDGWRRMALGAIPESQLDSVALPAGGGPGALIGGDNGLVLTEVAGQLAVAEPGDPYNGARGGAVDYLAARVPGLALLPGSRPGEVEAWVAIQSADRDRSPAPTTLLHYASNPGDPLLNPEARAQPLPDAPDRQPGEIRFAAFGKGDCGYANKKASCSEHVGTNLFHDLDVRRIVTEIAAADPAFALFTGDANDAGGRGVDETQDSSAVFTGATVTNSPLDPSVVHKRWADTVAAPLARAGVPLFAALGGQDLSRTPAGVGTNQPWRLALGEMPAPWGQGAVPPAHGTLTFRPVAGTGTPTDAGARTHYAFDVLDGDKPVVRVVVVDTSLRALATAEATQQPAESQTAWLAQALTRPAGEQAVVLSNSPTYSYGPGQNQLAQDASQFEAVLFANRVNAVVSGRIGWNGVYWATAPGVHEPCPGGDYRTQPPAAGTRDCAPAVAQETPDPANRVSWALRTLGAPAPPVDPAGVGAGIADRALPFVIASSAGGKLAADTDDASAANGFWHGYTVVRLSGDGDAARTVIEQRPVFDWIGLRASAHALRPGQRLTMDGFGREPIGTDQPIRYDQISSAAITHRYDLLEADPEQPWLPKVVKGNGNPHGYVPLDASIGTIDAQSGQVTAPRSNHGRVYGLVLLSVGGKTATWPLAFEPRRAYVAPPAPRLAVPPVPAVRVLGFTALSLAPPPVTPPPAAPPPVGTTLNLPAPPAVPQLPGAQPTPVAPIPPPAPPAPPGSKSGVALDLTVNPVGVLVPPTPGVTVQPTPPVQPAPPSGARREAKQRQAATAKSEQGAGEKAKDATGDLAQGPMPPTAAQMTRRDRVRADAGSITALPARAQPSAWTTGLEWGGGIALMALALALGFSGVRPTPRRRPPIVPAPAWQRRRR